MIPTERTVISNGKKKFVLEFDEAPAFVFVSEDGQNKEKIYKNGEEVEHWRSLKVFSDLDEFTTHEIDYVTVKKK
jgi:hypothetical protein